MNLAETQEKGLVIGDVVAGKYRLDEELGRGAMGVVYRAMQEPMGREVAIKTLLPQAVIHPSLISRFKREVKVISQLKHPNTITVFDYGSLDSGLLFFAMELLEGISLDEAIKAEGTLAPERVRKIVIQILKSLSEAHSIGIVHRDLKPQNIFICDVFGERDFVKVLDFGIAKALGQEGKEGPAPDVTDIGVTLGTPVYMAPEQIDHKAVSSSTDLYALGALMYEMLGGRQLFHGTGWLKIAMKKLGKSPIEIRNDILHGPFGGIILKAIQKDPKKRYQSAVEMVADLEALGSMEGVKRLPRVHASLTVTSEYDSLLIDGKPPRVHGEETPGDLSSTSHMASLTHSENLQDPMSVAPTTMTPRLERHGSAELGADDPTRVSAPIYSDAAATRLSTAKVSKPGLNDVKLANIQMAEEELVAFENEATRLLTHEPPSNSTQRIPEHEPVPGPQNPPEEFFARPAAIAPASVDVAPNEGRKAIMALFLLGLLLLTVAVIVIAVLIAITLPE